MLGCPEEVILLCMATRRIKESEFKSIPKLLEKLNKEELTPSLGETSRYLFRGQDCKSKLLPGIARKNPHVDSTEWEKKMLEELKRRSGLVINENFKNDWDWLAYAQHNGLYTRLLDWSSNPLIALWFAVQNPKMLKSDSYLYIMLIIDEDNLSQDELIAGPFNVIGTKIHRPNLNNRRVVAQHSWFTCHRFVGEQFSSLEGHRRFGRDRLERMTISSTMKISLLKDLDLLGINAQTVFPDMEGISKQINWENRHLIFEGV
jgi:hypothetical protein